ncbi:hypothetical protein Tco_0389610 [Tanacetum coccineum]
MLILCHKAKAALIRLSLVLLVSTVLALLLPSSTNAPEKEVHAVFADEVIYSLFAKQTEDLDFYKKQEGEFERLGWKNTVGFNKKKLDCFIVTIMSTLLGNVQQRCTRWKEEEDSPYQHQEAGKQREES